MILRDEMLTKTYSEIAEKGWRNLSSSNIPEMGLERRTFRNSKNKSINFTWNYHYRNKSGYGLNRKIELKCFE